MYDINILNKKWLPNNRVGFIFTAIMGTVIGEYYELGRNRRREENVRILKMNILYT